MRPVERGSVPSNPDGTPRVFRAYQDVRSDLICRLGEYCSYCEMQLDSSLAVEHVQPKKGSGARPDLELVWENFLLGCINCNSIKSHQAIHLEDYYWPDRDNTLRMLVYMEGGIIQPHPDLTPEEQQCAQRMIYLVGLDKIPPNDPRATDRRWNNRLYWFVSLPQPVQINNHYP
ncbi:HNH endonuclease [Candidatus Oscillochloris fontis]|uniref:HNH endonuclease n=1 Tax=Candidatus Oscillochloris fontis TaxID=2496868 RepID=UPI00101B62EB|nr:HNH endonuclease [Candidatus Oscillochloris fontis]